MIRPRDKGDVPDDPLSRMRHSASHVMADAVQRLRPDAKVAIGPSIETGFYYDFDTEPFAPEDAERIEAEMRKIIAENLPLRAAGRLARRGAASCSARAARTTRSRSSSRSPRARRSRTSSTATSSTSAAARTSSAPATSRPSRCCRSRAPTGAATSATRQLQRVYGTAFPSQAELDAYLAGIEEAKRRDHRVARQEARPVLDGRPGRPGLRRSGTRRAPSSATRSRTSSGARTSAAATTWSTRRTSRASSCSRRRATSRTTRRTCSAAWSSTASATWSSR